jgi:uncharacterized membrane protein YccC
MGNHASASDELPAIYRTILDRVALLERAGARSDAGRIRAAAIRAYSTSWDERHLHRLQRIAERASALLARLDHAADPDPRPADRRRRIRWWSPEIG